MQDENFDLDDMLAGLNPDAAPAAAAPAAPAAPARDMSAFLRKIPVSLTLEVGSAEISLAELTHIQNGSVIELDKLAGAPLDIKINGTVIGKAEVVVAGENYGLRVISLDSLDLGSLAP